MPIIELLAALIVVGIVAWLSNSFVLMSENLRRILNVVLALIVVGMALWVINGYVPMAGSIKGILNVVVVVATCVGVLQAVGLWSGVVRLWNNLTNHRVPH